MNSGALRILKQWKNWEKFQFESYSVKVKLAVENLMKEIKTVLRENASLIIRDESLLIKIFNEFELSGIWRTYKEKIFCAKTLLKAEIFRLRFWLKNST